MTQGKGDAALLSDAVNQLAPSQSYFQFAVGIKDERDVSGGSLRGVIDVCRFRSNNSQC